MLELELLRGYFLCLDGCPLAFLPSNMKIQTQRIALLRPRIKLCARTLELCIDTLKLGCLAFHLLRQKAVARTLVAFAVIDELLLPLLQLLLQVLDEHLLARLQPSRSVERVLEVLHALRGNCCVTMSLLSLLQQHVVLPLHLIDSRLDMV